jgi:hypothetical protein
MIISTEMKKFKPLPYKFPLEITESSSAYTDEIIYFFSYKGACYYGYYLMQKVLVCINGPNRYIKSLEEAKDFVQYDYHRYK